MTLFSSFGGVITKNRGTFTSFTSVFRSANNNKVVEIMTRLFQCLQNAADLLSKLKMPIFQVVVAGKSQRAVVKWTVRLEEMLLCFGKSHSKSKGNSYTKLKTLCKQKHAKKWRNRNMKWKIFVADTLDENRKNIFERIRNPFFQNRYLYGSSWTTVEMMFRFQTHLLL